jgi:hypothetical protein
MLVNYAKLKPSRFIIRPNPNVGYLVREGWYPHYTGHTNGLSMGHSRPNGLHSYIPDVSSNQYVIYISRYGLNKRVL